MEVQNMEGKMKVAVMNGIGHYDVAATCLPDILLQLSVVYQSVVCLMHEPVCR